MKRRLYAGVSFATSAFMSSSTPEIAVTSSSIWALVAMSGGQMAMASNMLREITPRSCSMRLAMPPTAPGVAAAAVRPLSRPQPVPASLQHAALLQHAAGDATHGAGRCGCRLAPLVEHALDRCDHPDAADLADQRVAGELAQLGLHVAAELGCMRDQATLLDDLQILQRNGRADRMATGGEAGA